MKLPPTTVLSSIALAGLPSPSISASAINRAYDDIGNLHVDTGILGHHDTKLELPTVRSGRIGPNVKLHRLHALQKGEPINSNAFDGRVDTGILSHRNIKSHFSRKASHRRRLRSLQQESFTTTQVDGNNNSTSEYCINPEICSDFCSCTNTAFYKLNPPGTNASNANDTAYFAEYFACVRDVCIDGTTATECFGVEEEYNPCNEVSLGCLEDGPWEQCECQVYVSNYQDDYEGYAMMGKVIDCCKSAEIDGNGWGYCIWNLRNTLADQYYDDTNGIIANVTQEVAANTTATQYIDFFCSKPVCSDFCACTQNEYSNIANGSYNFSGYYSCLRDVCLAQDITAECLGQEMADYTCNPNFVECLNNGSWEQCQCKDLVTSYDENMGGDTWSSEFTAQVECCKSKDVYGEGWSSCIWGFVPNNFTDVTTMVTSTDASNEIASELIDNVTTSTSNTQVDVTTTTVAPTNPATDATSETTSESADNITTSTSNTQVDATTTTSAPTNPATGTTESSSSTEASIMTTEAAQEAANMDSGDMDAVAEDAESPPPDSSASFENVPFVFLTVGAFGYLSFWM